MANGLIHHCRPQGHNTPIANSPIGTPSSIGSPITFQSGLKSTPASSSKARFMFGIGSGSDPANGGLGTHGWKSRSYKRYISKDRSLLKKLEDAWKGDNEREREFTSLKNIQMCFHTYIPCSI